jgi:peptide/nickel transport system permease protein
VTSPPEHLTATGSGASGANILAGADIPTGLATEVKARGYWEQVWRRFRRDKLAIAGGITIVLLFLVSFALAPIMAQILGHGPNVIYSSTGGLDSSDLPWGPLTHFRNIPYPGAIGHFHSVYFVLGSDGQLGRDEFLRLLYGGQASLEVAIGGMVMAMTLGVLLGSIAGFYGGWIDMLVSRATELVMAFPLILFIIALASTVGPSLNNITFGFLGKGVFTLTVVLAVFGWFYPARIVRAQVLSLREKEFVEAARMVGASDSRIIRSHLLPHLIAPIIVLGTITVAQFVLAEAGLSFLGVGIQEPTASWGSLLAQAPQYYLSQPWLMLWPGLAVLITTLAFNLLGDGLRDALDPRSSR